MFLEYLPISEKSKCETIHAIEQRLIVSLKVCVLIVWSPGLHYWEEVEFFKRQCLVGGH